MTGEYVLGGSGVYPDPGHNPPFFAALRGSDMVSSTG